MPATSLPAPTSATSNVTDMTVEELASRGGVSVRNIRAYNTAGLLPAPTLKGRLGLYGEEHLRRLELVRELRAQGFGIEAIRRIFERAPASSWRDLTVLAQSLSSGLFIQETPTVLTARQLAARWHGQMTPELQQRALRMGLWQALPDGRLAVLSPALSQIGEQLAALGLPLAQVLDMQEAMIANLRKLARSWFQALLACWLGDQHQPLDTRQLSELMEKARPLATGAVQAAFPLILQQELDARLRQQGSVRRQPRTTAATRPPEIAS